MKHSGPACRKASPGVDSRRNHSPMRGIELRVTLPGRPGSVLLTSVTKWIFYFFARFFFWPASLTGYDTGEKRAASPQCPPLCTPQTLTEKLKCLYGLLTCDPRRLYLRLMERRWVGRFPPGGEGPRRFKGRDWRIPADQTPVTSCLQSMRGHDACRREPRAVVGPTGN